MARVKMLKTASGPSGSFVVGQIVDLDDDTALAFAEAGAATLLNTPTPKAAKAVERAVVPQPETAVAQPQRRPGTPRRGANAPPRDPGAIGE